MIAFAFTLPLVWGGVLAHPPPPNITLFFHPTARSLACPPSQLFVCVVTTLGVYLAMDSNIRSQLNSLVGPTIMTAVLAYYTGKMVTGVYGMAITTILQCFVADEELFPPSQQFAENDLRGWVDKHGAPMEVDSGPRQSSSRTGANEYAFS